MKKTILGSLICANLLFASVPESMNFHSIAFDGGGDILANSEIAIKIELLDSSDSILYTETNSSVTTDSKGIFALKIGTQSTNDNFSSLNFSNVAKIKLSADLTGGTSYTEIGTKEFSTVPFAFVAKNLEGNGTIVDRDSMTAIGKYNESNITNSLFVVGNGTSNSDRNNSFIVTDKNTSIFGKLFLNGVEITAGESSVSERNTTTILNATDSVTFTGTNALAWGKDTTADQNYMTAIGKYNTTGNSNALFAVGNGTSNSDRNNSFVITDENTSVFGKLFVNGSEITTEIDRDTIFNRTTPTDETGTNALAWGTGATASGYVSTAWGGGTTASGSQSTAWGTSTTASGSQSTAWGDGTTASNGYATAWGAGTTASATFSTAWGAGAKALGSQSTAWGMSTTASAEYSTTWGGSTRASAEYSTAWGHSTTASGTKSTAWGQTTTASGYVSTAWGENTTASTDYSTAWGLRTTASGQYSTAWGSYTTASGQYSTAFGLDTNASGDESTAFGYNTTASGQYSTAWGNESNASGKAATAWGRSTIASGDNYPTAWGYETTASGKYHSTAWGYKTTASGDSYPTAWGYYATASGDKSTAWGEHTTASANESTAWGYHARASGTKSTAWGEYTNASGTLSTAWGLRTTADQDYMTAIGKYNTTGNTDALFVVGNGTGVGSESDAFEVQIDGDILYAGTSASSSDERLKTNIKKIDNSIEKVKGINGVTYNWIAENREQSTQVGVIAQDVQKVMPELVREGSDGYLSVSYTSMVGLLVEAIKEQQKSIDKLQKALEKAGISIEE